MVLQLCARQGQEGRGQWCFAPAGGQAPSLHMPAHGNTCACMACLHALSRRYGELMSDVAYVDGVLAKGAETANETAERTLDSVKDAMGFVLPPKK